MSELSPNWKFDPRLAGCRRKDGVHFRAALYDAPPDRLIEGGHPDWVWLVYWSNSVAKPVWIDPVKRGLETPAQVEAYIDSRWPMPEVNP